MTANDIPISCKIMALRSASRTAVRQAGKLVLIIRQKIVFPNVFGPKNLKRTATFWTKTALRAPN